jgi:hypothetical protein
LPASMVHGFEVMASRTLLPMEAPFLVSIHTSLARPEESQTARMNLCG